MFNVRLQLTSQHASHALLVTEDLAHSIDYKEKKNGFFGS
jgi:hypothetical protein